MTTALLGLFDDKTDVELDIDTLVGSHLCISANSGAGKSGAIRKLLETTHGSLQHIVIDVEDEFYTLREKFEYLIAGGDNGDCAANVNNAAALATTILKAGISAIVQINSLNQDDREDFIATFLQTLTEAPKALWRPLLLVLDEAQFYAPQIGNAASSSAVINFMMLGRKRGFTGVLATPRAADLDKRATAPVNNWLVGRCGQPADRRAAAAAVGFSDRSPEAIELRSLPSRTFWAFGPALSLEPRKIRVGQTDTTIVKAGQATLPTPPAPAAMRKILEGLNAAAKAAEVETASETTQKRVVSEPDPEAIADAEARGYQRGLDHGDQMLREAVPVWFRRGVEAAFQGIEALNTHDFVREQIQQWGDLGAFDFPNGTADQAAAGPRVVAPDQHVGAKASATSSTAKASEFPKPPPQVKRVAQSDGALSGSAVPLLQALARLNGQRATWDHACVLAGLVPGNGYFYKGRKALTEGGFVTDGGGTVAITDAGINEVGTQVPLRLREIIALWNAKLRQPGGQMLSHLAKTPTQWVGTDELAAALNMKAGNGYWYKGVKVAREAHLIDQEKGQFRLSEYLRSAPR